MATTATSAPKAGKANSAATVEKKIEAFFTRETEKGTPVSLWIVGGAKGMPDFDGKIGTQRVVVRIRRSAAKGNFLAINKRVKADEKTADGKPTYKEEQIGTANLVVTEKGMPRMSIKLAANKGKPNETVWASISKKVSDDMLTDAGLNLAKLAEKRAEVKAAKDAKPPVEKIATPVADKAPKAPKAA